MADASMNERAFMEVNVVAIERDICECQWVPVANMPIRNALDLVFAGFADFEQPIYGGCDVIDEAWGDNEVEPFYFDDGYVREDYEDCCFDRAPYIDPAKLYRAIPGFEQEISFYEYVNSLPTIPKKYDFRQPIPQPLRWAVFKRDEYTCAICDCEYDLSVDHIIPVCQGGPTSSWNLRTLCRPCNSRKGGR